MDKLAIINNASLILSDIVFIMAMLVVVLVAACFLGRYVVITRKMIIATLGVVILQILFIVLGSLFIEKVFPDLNSYISNPNLAASLDVHDPIFEKINMLSDIMSFVLNGSVFLYAFIFYLIVFKEKKLLRAIEATVCLILLYLYINTIAQYTYVFLFGKDLRFFNTISTSYNDEETIYFTGFNVLLDFILVAAILVILYFGYYRRKRFYTIKVVYRVLFVIWLFMFNSLPIFALVGDTPEQRVKVLSFTFGLILPFLAAIAPVLVVMIAAEKSLKEKNEYQANYLAAELEYIERYKNAQTETRAFRHDIINNLSLTSMMLDEGKVDEAGEHLREMLGEVRSYSPSIITGDEMLDCIVAMKADKMKELGIEFSLDGVIDGGLNMKPMDVCSIFANALDNAIEAVSRLNAGTPGWIKMLIKRTEKFFVISISNMTDGIVDAEKIIMTAGYTSKNDKEHHGFGLRNIRNTVEDYNGLLKAESDDGSFILKIMIPRQ